MLELKNPPLVEVGVSFDFEPNARKSGWDLEILQKLINHYKDSLPNVEAQHDTNIEFQETSPTELPKVVKRETKLMRARAMSEGGDRVFEIRDDAFTNYFVKLKNSYPGYDSVRDETIEKLRTYIRFFGPANVKSAAIHYVDIVEIPRPEGGTIEMDDYFQGSADLPLTPFGTIGAMAVHFMINPPTNDGPLFYRLQSIPSTSDQPIRMRMDWRKQCLAINSLDIEEICSRLDRAHEYVSECFQKSLTERTLDLFGRTTEG